ncbi:CDP-glycerol--UDP-pyrophosphoryl-N-acetylglucosaminyl-N-acetylmannosamine glycerophosphotransferase [Pseudomonas sp. SWRI92]|uniref:CDP-glycerol--UDP-pyrophosphoryl-N-acetylglucosaminyl-N-acetylmannosamine glycerophosphotransferase n=1 Tax=Pseudomonas marvdashtae TaxID=2745500 RepID=A0A923FQE8_9PSED|nr:MULTISPECIES: SOS-induced cell division inhibitor SulA [Pseudomonas]MBC3362047.1 CDP-glycerol--UDP-pyrophosphoryl-N-acetylglucosaminyl-N-acetylmannosamine glycerophosphotransferase [Pseudomonas sp. SWRI154]MBC3374488.1 CDP-glycerol--UDP-pyrophosphoryl-N-acetylglucosaminyl-N-acetylmannosamine glycerophosphotransferase [Pseudomonas sp. SWRI92]MBV4552827.1 CDP-glycerol--UDP-pyrophosphoryl-N-acetylglucosaminyl-N-acetylmannosamine glycerophosphotransferase [Pseudomonas marvdashtae]
MQFPHAPQHTQLPLFEAFMAQPLVPVLQEVIESPWGIEPEAFSELSLRGAAGNCLNLLAPILRELSQDQDARWLTLIAPPASVTQAWLRDAGLNRERILLLQPRGTQSAQQLTCEALRLGRSHTVVSWLNPLTATARQQLISAARIGDAQSLNIRLG